MLCSDAAFGSLPWRYQITPAWGNIRIGDLVEYDDHVVVVVDKSDDSIKITDSGVNNKVYWGGSYLNGGWRNDPVMPFGPAIPNE